MFKGLVGCSAIVTGVVALVACEGKQGTADEAPPVGEHAELVAKKRAWLEGYDRHCEACVVAFELCGKGAVDDDERIACQVAMDACIRGGLLGSEEDGGVADEDAAVDADDDADVYVVDDDDVDDVEDEDAYEADAGEVYEDAGIEDADAGADDDADDAEDERDELVTAVGVCLEQARACLADEEVEVRQCLGDLRRCVKGALAGSFESTCQAQVRSCRESGGSHEMVLSVERQCRHQPEI